MWLQNLLLENFINTHKSYCNTHAVKVTAEFNEEFSISISPETVWVLRVARLNGHSAHRKFFVAVKKQKT